MHTLHASPRRSGFSLVEVLAVLAIVAVLATAAVPWSRSIGVSMKLSAFATGFLSRLHLARSEAIKRRVPVVLCKTADGAACSTEGGWEQGGIVFVDRNGDGERAGDEPVLERLEGLPAGFRLRGNLNVARYVSFSPSGATRTSAGAFQAGTLTVCRASLDPGEARQIIINAVGRPRLHKLQLAVCE